jgi:hypothetical protein
MKDEKKLGKANKKYNFFFFLNKKEKKKKLKKRPTVGCGSILDHDILI